MREGKQSGYWNYAGKVVKRLRERGMPWKIIAEIFGAGESTLHNAAYRASARKWASKPKLIEERLGQGV